MTSTLKTELRAFTELKGNSPTRTLKSGSVEASKNFYNMGRVLARNCDVDIGKAYHLT